jgi:hypothetical protein
MILSCISSATALFNKKLIANTFWLTLITPYSPVTVKWCFGGTYCLPLQWESTAALLVGCFMQASRLAYSLTLKREAICSSKPSVDFHQTTWCYISEDITLQSLLWQPQIQHWLLLTQYITWITHGAEPFSRSHQLCSYSRTSQDFMEPGDSSPHSHKPSIGPYPEPDRSNPYHPILPL